MEFFCSSYVAIFLLQLSVYKSNPKKNGGFHLYSRSEIQQKIMYLFLEMLALEYTGAVCSWSWNTIGNQRYGYAFGRDSSRSAICQIMPI